MILLVFTGVESFSSEIFLVPDGDGLQHLSKIRGKKSEIKSEFFSRENSIYFGIGALFWILQKV